MGAGLQKLYRDEWIHFKRRFMWPTIACGIGFAVMSLFSYSASMEDMAAARNLYDQIGQAFAEKGFAAEMQNIELFWRLFSNNITAGFLVFLAGFIPFLFLPFWAVLSNAAMVGVVVAVSHDSGWSLASIALSLLPHGVVELPALFFSAGLGIRICLVLSKKIFGGAKEVKFAEEFAGAVQLFFLVGVPLFLLAAFIEAFVTMAIVSGAG